MSLKWFAIAAALLAGAGLVSAAVSPPVRTSFPTEQGKPFKAPRQLVSKDGLLRATIDTNAGGRSGRPSRSRARTR